MFPDQPPAALIHDASSGVEIMSRRTASLFSRLALGAATAVTLATVAALPASAQALRSSSASSLAAGATSDRNSVSTPNTTGLPGASERQSITTGTGSGSAVSILGMPLRVAAPVTPPYDGDESYSTFAGQAATGKEAVLQQSIDGAP